MKELTLPSPSSKTLNHRSRYMKKKGLYFVDVPVYDREIAVIIDLSHEEVLREAKKQKCGQQFIDALNDEETKYLCEKVHSDSEATEAAVRRLKMRTFLFLRKPKNNWFFWDTLNHETFHISQFFSHQFTMWDDVEPPAYLHSWLFKTLRRFLSDSKKK